MVTEGKSKGNIQVHGRKEHWRMQERGLHRKIRWKLCIMELSLIIPVRSRWGKWSENRDRSSGWEANWRDRGMSAMKRSTEINIVSGIGIFACVAIAAYWFFWFAMPGAVQARTPGDPDYASYTAYELAFPLPDAFVAGAALVGVLGLRRMKDWGFLSMLLAAGGAIFLGLEDLLFDLENRMFTPFDGAAVIELAIILLILALGPAMTVLLWKHRRELIR